MTKIGLTYIRGAIPGFENFGNLPTDFVNSEGLVHGNKASKELDALIIPGGTIVESGDYSEDLKSEIRKMANDGKPVIGICGGFQLLSNQTDIGRNSPCPIIKEGLGLIDVEFSPLISSDRVKAEVIDNSFITEGVKEDITGFHCHTYGKVTGDAKPLFYSKIQRMNYGDVDEKVLSGAVNDEGNVIGTLVHNCLDENPFLVKNLLSYIDAKDPEEIYLRNKSLKERLTKEIGIKTNIKTSPRKEFKTPKFLMIGSNGSDSGKTFILTGLAGALAKRGYKVGLLKVGPDARDIVPGLYLTKGLMEEYGSIKIGQLGWQDFKPTVERLKNSDYDIILIEGVMSLLTGLLNPITPYSAVEIALSSNVPILLVGGVNKGGIESAAVELVSHANLIEKIGGNVRGIILNKIYNQEILENVVPYIKANANVDNVQSIKKQKLEKRGNTPEVEIRYDEFCQTAYRTVEENLNVENIIGLAEPVKFKDYLNFEEIKNRFNGG